MMLNLKQARGQLGRADRAPSGADRALPRPRCARLARARAAMRTAGPAALAHMMLPHEGMALPPM